MFSLRAVSLIVILPLLYETWVYNVNLLVPEPYLDEFFHIQQAQAYCAGSFGQWDPKITTPPGLYFISYFFNFIKEVVFSTGGCSVAELRLLNLCVACPILPLQLFNVRQGVMKSRRVSLGNDDVVHAVVNMSLFPLVFFFSGLYYTDICSISLVLAAYQVHLWAPHEPLHRLHVKSLAMLLIGLCALLMRQTNIFWVAIFLAGLTAVRQLKRNTGSKKFVGQTHDPPAEDAFIEGQYF